MSRFYRELHDRELLAQAASTLAELQQRCLIDVLLSEADVTREERAESTVFPRRFSSIQVEHGKLVVTVEKSFFSTAKAGSD